MTRGDPVVTRFLRPSRYRLGAAVGATIFAVMATAVPVFADVSAVGGGAFAESVNLTRTGQTHQISGPMPHVTLPATGGGPFTSSLASANIAHVITTGLLAVSTRGSLGANGSAQSGASIANISAFDGYVTIQTLTSQCKSDSNGSTGSSTITGLVVNGKPVTIGTAPNTVLYNKYGLKVVFNEQVNNDKPNFADIRVTALHVSLTTPAGVGNLLLDQVTCHAEGPNVIIPEAPHAFPGTALGRARDLRSRVRDLAAEERSPSTQVTWVSRRTGCWEGRRSAERTADRRIPQVHNENSGQNSGHLTHAPNGTIGVTSSQDRDTVGGPGE